MIIYYKDKPIFNRCSYGTDIEFVIKNTKGNYVSAIPFIKGTKKHPDYVEGGNLQRDNIALEIAVDASNEIVELIRNTRSCLQEALEQLPYRYSIEAVPSVLMPSRLLLHPEAQEFGCDADYDAKTKKANKFCGTVDPRLRTFGLHIHTGFEHPIRQENKEEFARLHVLVSDAVLGLMSTMVDSSMEALRRRELYGKPSCYRIKPYGVEYRTLSNFWAKSPMLMDLAFTLNVVINNICRNDIKYYFDKIDPQEIHDIILSGDSSRASEIFFDFVYNNVGIMTKSKIINVLERKTWRSLAEEWDLNIPGYYDVNRKPRTVKNCIRPDYTPKGEQANA